MYRHLNTMFSKDAPWTKTYAGALRRITKFQEAYDATQTPGPRSNRTNVITTVITMQGADETRYLPVVIMGGEAYGWVMNLAIQCGCGVTNVA